MRKLVGVSYKRNYRCPHGEIDLVLEKGRRRFFLEVKYDSVGKESHMLWSPKQRQRFLKSSHHFLSGRSQKINFRMFVWVQKTKITFWNAEDLLVEFR